MKYIFKDINGDVQTKMSEIHQEDIKRYFENAKVGDVIKQRFIRPDEFAPSDVDCIYEGDGVIKVMKKLGPPF
jgi:hypothetical protein